MSVYHYHLETRSFSFTALLQIMYTFKFLPSSLLSHSQISGISVMCMIAAVQFWKPRSSQTMSQRAECFCCQERQMKDVPGRTSAKSFHDPDIIPFGDNYPAVSSFEWAEHVFQHVTERMPIWRFSASRFQPFSFHESVQVLFSYTIRRSNELGPVP